MNKRLLVVVLVVAALCAAWGEGKGEQAAGPASGTIKLWTQLAREPGVVARDKVIQAFKKDNPNVNFEIVLLAGDAGQKIQTAAAANTLPDFMHLYDNGMVLSFGQMGIVAPVTDVVKELPEDFFLSKKMLQRLYIKNEYWGIPSVTFPSVLFYRADWFGQKGLSGAPKTWAEWLSVGKKFVEDTNGDGKVDRWGSVLGIAEGWPLDAIRGSNADYWWDAQGNPTYGPKTRETIDFLRKLFDETCYPGSTTLVNETQRLAFLAGNGATMNTSVSFIYPLMEDKEKGLEWLKKGVAKLASVPMNRPLSEGAGSGTGNHALCVTQGKNIALAKKFLRFWIKPETSALYFSYNIPGHLPPYRKVWDDKGFQEARKDVYDVYRSGMEVIAASQWEHPAAAWAGIFNTEGGGGQQIMEAITVKRLTTDQVMDQIKKAMETAKKEIK